MRAAEAADEEATATLLAPLLKGHPECVHLTLLGKRDEIVFSRGRSINLENDAALRRRLGCTLFDSDADAASVAATALSAPLVLGSLRLQVVNRTLDTLIAVTMSSSGAVHAPAARATFTSAVVARVPLHGNVIALFECRPQDLAAVLGELDALRGAAR